MNKYNLAITFLTIVVLISIIGAFMAIGSPFAQKAIAEDNQRISDMTNIQRQIENYYQTHGVLPQNLDQTTGAKYLDPISKTPYEYNVVSETTYNLCTTFSAESTTDTGTNLYGDTASRSHSEGYDCISFTIPTYITGNNIPTKIPEINWQPLVSTVEGTIEALTLTTTPPKMIISVGNISKIIYIEENVDILNEEHKEIDITTFEIGDEVEVDTSFTQANTYFKASYIINKSR